MSTALWDEPGDSLLGLVEQRAAEESNYERRLRGVRRKERRKRKEEAREGRRRGLQADVNRTARLESRQGRLHARRGYEDSAKQRRQEIETKRRAQRLSSAALWLLRTGHHSTFLSTTPLLQATPPKKQYGRRKPGSGKTRPLRVVRCMGTFERAEIVCGRQRRRWRKADRRRSADDASSSEEVEEVDSEEEEERRRQEDAKFLPYGDSDVDNDTSSEEEAPIIQLRRKPPRPPPRPGAGDAGDAGDAGGAGGEGGDSAVEAAEGDGRVGAGGGGGAEGPEPGQGPGRGRDEGRDEGPPVPTGAGGGATGTRQRPCSPESPESEAVRPRGRQGKFYTAFRRARRTDLGPLAESRPYVHPQEVRPLASTPARQHASTPARQHASTPARQHASTPSLHVYCQSGVLVYTRVATVYTLFVATCVCGAGCGCG